MRIPLLILLSTAFSIVGAVENRPGGADHEFDAMNVDQLESRLANIDAELKDLSSLSLRGGTGSIGYRSERGRTSEWIEIQLDSAYPIDEIILVPCLFRHPTRGFIADAFPRQIRVLAGTNPDERGTEIATYQRSPSTLKGIEPLVLPTSRIQASWIRIEATALTDRYWDKDSVLQLSEVLVFSGPENVALHSAITTSSSDHRGASGAWHERFLVDGFTPYIMDSARGSSSAAFIAFAEFGSSFTLDLGEPYSLSRLHLHGVEQSDTVPQAYSEGLGIPQGFLVEGSLQADFSEKVPLFDFEKINSQSTGPIIMTRFPDVSCRFVRFTPSVPPLRPNDQPDSNRIGFAEIEAISNGQNIALHSEVTYVGMRSGGRSLTALTDGNNLYGQILPLRKWMNELAKRGALERERPVVIAELDLRHARQKTLLTRMIQLVFILLVVIGFIILIDRHFRMQKINQVRERIAADLHDELGANIHTIGLISDMAKKAMDSRPELSALLDEIRVYTQKSGEAARYCTNILEARGVCEDLVDEMKKFAERSLADLTHEFEVKGEEILQKLPPHTRIDLLLFYKECLTNILRHSGASKVRTRLYATHKSIQMIVSDNGKGFGTYSAQDGAPPKSLVRRAQLLKANIITEQARLGGARITLTLKNRRLGIFS